MKPGNEKNPIILKISSTATFSHDESSSKKFVAVNIIPNPPEYLPHLFSFSKQIDRK